MGGGYRLSRRFDLNVWPVLLFLTFRKQITTVISYILAYLTILTLYAAIRLVFFELRLLIILAIGIYPTPAKRQRLMGRFFDVLVLYQGEV